MTSLGSGPRVRAPRFTAGADWFGTRSLDDDNDRPLTLDGLRGRFVLLDFWTSCCANCLHVIEELRPLEARFADVLTVVGVHSPKFPHEAEPTAVAAAIARNDLHHPVVNDPGLRMWREYAVRAWPTLVLVDPEGYVVAQAAGEGHVDSLALLLEQQVAVHEARGTLRRSHPGAPASPPPDTALRFPAKAILLPAGRTGRDADTLLVADAGHHELAELALDARTVLRRIGTGARGRSDGAAADASFAEPNGLTLLPPGLTGYDVLVADTANHLLRGVRLRDGAVVTTVDLAAALAEARTITGPVPAVTSPWDVAWWPAAEEVVVAAAGVHLLLGLDPRTGRVRILAGTTVEGLRDGPALDTWLAQPSGLAVDGDQVWFVDAESSALRRLTLDGQVHTAVGEGLFDFGHVDGPAVTARMQHPLGVALLSDGAVVVTDTYNGALRRFDPATEEMTTLAEGLAEPSGTVAVGHRLLIVESAAHRIGTTDRHHAPTTHDGAGAEVQRPPVSLAPGRVELTIAHTPPPGRHLDERDGPAIRLDVSASPGLLTSGDGESNALTRELELAADGVLQVSVQVLTCDDDTVAHPACHVARQDWGIPVSVTSDGEDRLRLVLLG